MKLEPSGVLARLRRTPAFVNFGWLSLDKLIRLALGVIVGMWVARYLGPKNYGLLNYGITLAVLTAILPGLGLDAIVRRQFIRSPAETGVLLGTTFTLRLGMSVLSYGLLLLLSGLLEPDPHARLAIALAGFSVLQQPILAIDLWFQSQLLSKHTIIAHNTSFALCSALRVLGILRGASLTWFLVLLAVETCFTSTLLVSAYLRSRPAGVRWRFDAIVARRLVRESWPLALAAAATLVYVRIDQVMIRTISGPEEVGIYAAAARLMEILHALPLMIAASCSPGLVRARELGTAEYHFRLRRFFNLMAGSAWLATVGCILVGPVLLPILLGTAYAPAGDILIVLAFSLPLIALGVARQEYLVNEGRQRFQLVTTLFGAVTNVALNLWAIPRWGGLGAAAATVAAHLVADLLTTLAWRPARNVGAWQLRALGTFWRPVAAPSRPTP